MDKYTIFCTPEQTKKALELGALITVNAITDEPMLIYTAEQMIGWLEEQGITSIEITFSKETKWKFEMFSEIYDYGAPYYSRKEATLAAIDAALEYLMNSEKQF